MENSHFRFTANSKVYRKTLSFVVSPLKLLTQIEKVSNEIAKCLVVKSRMMVRVASKTSTKDRIYVFAEKRETKNVFIRQHEKFTNARIASRRVKLEKSFE